MTVLVQQLIFNQMQNYQNSGVSGLLSNMSIGATPRRSSSSSSSNGGGRIGKRPGKRPGRKPSKIDEHAKLERSRQSARECRARKKLRYQYLEELVLNREKAVFALRDELETFKQWCIQMDNGGPVPEALVKMIVTEDLKHQKRQMEEARKSIQQQQQQQMRRMVSTSSSSSGDSPPLRSTHLSHQQQQSQQWRQMQHHLQMSGGAARESQMQQVANISNSQHHLHATQTGNIPVSGIKLAPPLRRQMAVDIPQAAAQSYNHYGATNTEQKLPSTIMAGAKYPSQTQGSSGSSNMIRVRSEPPLRYEHSMDTSSSSLFCAVDSQEPSSSMNISPVPGPSRGRSLSNPMSMASVSRSPLPTSVLTSRHIIPGHQMSAMSPRSVPSMSPRSVPSMSPRSVPSATVSSRHVAQQGQGQSLGLFSGNTLSKRSSSSGLILPITVEESSSSEESDAPDQPPFSSTFAQKRTLSDPALQQNLKRSQQHPVEVSLPSTTLPTTPFTTSPHNFPQSLASLSTSSRDPSSLNVDPHVTLNNLTNVHCFSGTRTSNTPSPAPYNLIPVGREQTTTASPAPSSYQQSITPTSSNNPSPAPLLSLNTFLEISGSSLQSTAGEMAGDEIQPFDPSIPNFLFSQQMPIQQCNSTGLSASISEPIPEFYSFLADLHDTEMSLSSRHGAASGHGTPMALTPRSGEQPATPDTSMLNLPNIIEDLLDNKSKT